MPAYVVLRPVKPPRHAKSRLGGLPREALATAFALDVASACLASESVSRVLAVTDDAGFAQSLQGIGCEAIPDGVAGDLNRSLELAAMEASRRWPELVPVALCADLPCLLPADLDAALSQRPGRPRYVADDKGTGTTLYTAPLEEFAPRFGPDSGVAHLEDGAWPIEGELLTARHDVDDVDDLRAAIALGIGPHTSRALALLPADAMDRTGR
jgi:2-phospho-L-lactate guanylyltransferase